jgi:hypothetical protein
MAEIARRRSTLQSLGGIIRGYIDPRATVYRGVSMRSRLEADFAWHLDQRGIRWRYEPAIFGPVGEGYLPDFQLLRNGERHYVEVKPTLAEVEAAGKRMEIIWDTYPDAVLIVACGEGCQWFARERGAPAITWVERWKHQ